MPAPFQLPIPCVEQNVSAAEQWLSDPRPVLAAVGHQIVDRHAIDARCPAVAHDARVCGDEVLSSHDQLNARQSLGSAGMLACRARLTHATPTSHRPSVASLRGP